MADSIRILVLGNVRSPHTQRWAQGFASRGWNVHILSIRQGVVEGVAVHSEFLGPANSASWAWSLLSYLRLLLRATFWVRRIRPDIVNAHFSVTHGAIAVLSRMHPLVITTWGKDVVGADGVLKGPRVWINRFVLRRADQVTVTSRYMVDPVSRLSGSSVPIKRVPFGVDTAVFRPLSIPDTDQAFTIGYVKHLKPKYGPEYLIRALPRVIANVPNAILLMAGEGELRADLENLAGVLGVSDKVTFLGRLEHSQVPGLLRSFDVLVNPSVEQSETFGVVLLEGSATGLPVVATDVGGVSEVVLHSRTGILVPSADAEALTSALVFLAQNKAIAHRMGAEGRRFVKDTYEWDSCLEKMMTLLRDAAHLD